MQVSTYANTVPVWVLALGGVGVVIGLATYGYKVGGCTTVCVSMCFPCHL